MTTTKAAHTPGPWEEKFGGVYIISETGKRCMSTHEIPLYMKQIREANARLIAAAPEMLEALESCVTHGYYGSQDKVLAAIQKARGGQ
jgi:hypothetical protein